MEVSGVNVIWRLDIFCFERSKACIVVGLEY